MFVREKVIKAILDSGENFMSGEQLSKKLGISRTAVWKHINALREEGYNIESVNKKGYRLAEKPDDILSSENIAYNFEPSWSRAGSLCLTRRRRAPRISSSFRRGALPPMRTRRYKREMGPGKNDHKARPPGGVFF